MVFSGLQAAAAVLVPSFGIATGSAQPACSGLERLFAGDHAHFIGRHESRRTPGAAATGRQIAHGGRHRNPVGTGCDL